MKVNRCDAVDHDQQTEKALYHRAWVYQKYGFDAFKVKDYERRIAKGGEPISISNIPLDDVEWDGLTIILVIPMVLLIIATVISREPAMAGLAFASVLAMFFRWSVLRRREVDLFNIELENYKHQRKYYNKFWACDNPTL